MAREKSQSGPAVDPRDPLPWLLTLEMARQRGDFDQAAAAKRELVRLGVTVTYKPLRGVKRGKHAAR